MNLWNKVLIADDSKAKSKIIRSNQKIDCEVDVLYKQVWWVKEQLKDTIFSDEAEFFKWISVLLQVIKRDSKEQRMIYIKVKVNKNNRFYWCWVFSKATIKNFEHCWNFVAIDDTHCTATHCLTLLALTTLDDNDNILSLCWALILSENAENWAWFL